MRYIPHTEKDILEMLKLIGVQSIQELFSHSIDPHIRTQTGEVELPEAADEIQLLKEFEKLSSLNKTTKDLLSFLGGGAYDHYIPSAIKHIISRGEFLTSYTPYQAQLSQGTLQAIFEYQTMIAELTGMDISNASMYDGATSMVEAALLAVRNTKRPDIIFSSSIHPEYLDVAGTYIDEKNIKILPSDIDTGTVSQNSLQNLLDSSTACVIIQNPNFFGCIEDVEETAKKVHSNGSLCIVIFTEALSLGLLNSPGAMGADIAAGEGQSLGIPLSFGGPYLGLFAVKKDFMKAMPGRIAGMTVDSRGNTGYTLTLQAREQHIRRERATSNICTNQGLCSLIATIYLSLLGPEGLRKVALYNHAMSEKLKKMLSDNKGCKILYNTHTFNEFVLRTGISASELNSFLLEKGIVGGLALSRFYPERKNDVLITVTEKITDSDLIRLNDEIKTILAR
jgi:glycine dehydrogenase subunit 1